jgi:hypothetical protein
LCGDFSPPFIVRTAAVTLLPRTLVDPFVADIDVLRRARYGVIEVAAGRLAAIHLRPWPKIISALEVEWLGNRLHAKRAGDRCWLYYNQPRRHGNYLALKYIVSSADCTFASFRRAVLVLDEVARVKRSDALLCDAWNLRISDRLFARWGWEAHLPSRWHRHYIKRFYGNYPANDGSEPVARGPSAAQATCQQEVPA